MPLDPATEKRIRDEAAKRGADPDKAVAHAESLSSDKAGKDARPGATPASGDGKILVGFLPFVKVSEVRAQMGLGPIADDDLMTGEFLAKHGGAAAAPASAEPPA